MVLALASLGVALRVARGGWIEHSLAALVPPVGEDPATRHALDEFTRRLERQVTLAVAHADQATAREAAGWLAQALAQLPAMSSVRNPVMERDQRAWPAFYAPFRWQLLAREPQRLLEQNQGTEWRRHVLALVYNPFAGVSGAELADDPFLLLRHFLLERGGEAGFAASGGWAARQDFAGRWHVRIMGELGADPYDIVMGQAFLADIEALESRLASHFPGATLLRQGAVFHAGTASRRAQFEVSTIGLGSLLGVILLNLYVFRHILPLALTVLSIGGGLVAATAVTLWLTGPLHLFTLVFGTTLIGVTEDYSSHFLCHHARRGVGEDGAATLQRILPALVMSLATTLLAYLALLLTPFDVLRQLTVFSVSGLAVSFLIVALWFPVLGAPLRPRPLPGVRLAERWLGVWRRADNRYRWLPLVLLAALALPVATGLRARDDIRELQSVRPGLARQEQAMTALFGGGGSTRIVLVRGADTETLLQRMEAVTARLEDAAAADELGGYLALSAFVPSERRQRENFALVQQRLLRPGAGPQAQVFGLTAGAASGQRKTPFTPLRFAAWLSSPVSEGLRLLWQDSGADGQFAVVPLREIKAPEAVRARLNGLEGVSYVDRPGEISTHFREYRLRVAVLLVVAAALTFLLLVWRYGWGRALRIQSPCLVAALCALAALRLAGLPFNLFSVLALLLVLGMGIDYTLFFVETRRETSVTWLSVSLACATTTLSFGLLAFSSTPAIANFGIVVGAGVLTAYLLAPLALEGDD
jgi:predicted exporter